MSKQAADLKLAVVGNYESVLPFQAVGMESFILSDDAPDEIVETLNRLSVRNYAVIFLLEEWYSANKALVDELNETSPASIIPIPGLQGSLGVGIESIRESVERAVGMDIFATR
jgi:V/A-type H+-transporting ATPase subunit F